MWRLLLLLPCLLTGGAFAAGTPLPQGDIAVTDDTGRTVRLPAPAQRIVTLSPHATELVYAAGAGDRLVAVAPFSDFPPQAAGLPAIGGLGGLDRERLLALDPDLVVAWDSGNSTADLAWLDGLDIAVYRSEPRALAGIARNLLDLGRLAGTDARAAQAAEGYRQALAGACGGPASGLPVFIQLSAQPLLTVGGGHWLDRAVRRAGLRNVYAELPGRAVAVSRESLLVRQPAVVVYLAYPGVEVPEGAVKIESFAAGTPLQYLGGAPFVRGRPVPGPNPAARPVTSPGPGSAFAAGTPPTTHLPQPIAIGLDPALWARPGPRLPAGIAQLCRVLQTALTPAPNLSHSRGKD